VATDWSKHEDDYDRIGELVQRTRRIETRLCTLMEHLGMVPKSDNTFEKEAEYALPRESLSK
jgi:hypothetical protein